MSFNKLTPAQAERLALLAEECGEVVVAIGKILRHGYDSCHPFSDASDNRDDLQEECGDVLAAIKLLTDARELDADTIADHCSNKLLAVGEWLHHAKVKP
jgi:NTP pyrophosphatase (non-canonical NTP hydrolase)